MVYLVFNTICNLTSQAAQVPCFATPPPTLRPAAALSSRSVCPSCADFRPADSLFHVSPTRWALDVYDTATQAMSSNYVNVTGGRGQCRFIPFRYAPLAELDLMARLAGLLLRDRFDGWTREPFTSDSRQHASIWEKPAGQCPSGGNQVTDEDERLAGRDQVCPHPGSRRPCPAG